jgi:hypothetical protein
MRERRHPLQITHGGRKYNGAYRVEDGLVKIESAYGSRAADIGKRGEAGVEALAQALMRQLVEAWRPGAPVR